MKIKLLNYSISGTIITVIALFAWQSGKDQPLPGWVMEYLIPFLGWAYIVLVIVAIVGRKKTRHSKPDAHR